MERTSWTLLAWLYSALSANTIEDVALAANDASPQRQQGFHSRRWSLTLPAASMQHRVFTVGQTASGRLLLDLSVDGTAVMNA